MIGRPAAYEPIRVAALPEVNEALLALQKRQPMAAIGLQAARQHLEAFGSDAHVPDVKWRIEAVAYPHQSRMGELRWPGTPQEKRRHPRDAWRVLFYCNAPKSDAYGNWRETFALLIAIGNKHNRGDSWYDEQIKALGTKLDRIRRYVDSQ